MSRPRYRTIYHPVVIIGNALKDVGDTRIDETEEALVLKIRTLNVLLSVEEYLRSGKTNGHLLRCGSTVAKLLGGENAV